MKGILYFDGSCFDNGNNGAGKAAAVLQIENTPSPKIISETLKATTNNIAEYTGLILGLSLAIEHNITDLTIYGDSTLVINTFNDTWKCHKPHLIPLKIIAINLRKHFNSVNASWIPRDKNTLADHYTK